MKLLQSTQQHMPEHGRGTPHAETSPNQALVADSNFVCRLQGLHVDLRQNFLLSASTKSKSPQQRLSANDMRVVWPSLNVVITVCLHILAFNMALLEFLLKCFRRKPAQSEQDRPLVQSADSSGEETAPENFAEPAAPVPPTPTVDTSDLGPKPAIQVLLPASAVLDQDQNQQSPDAVEVAAPATPQVGSHNLLILLPWLTVIYCSNIGQHLWHTNSASAGYMTNCTTGCFLWTAGSSTDC